jgi:hypothetical protein
VVDNFIIGLFGKHVTRSCVLGHVIHSKQHIRRDFMRTVQLNGLRTSELDVRLTHKYVPGPIFCREMQNLVCLHFRASKISDRRLQFNRNECLLLFVDMMQIAYTYSFNNYCSHSAKRPTVLMHVSMSWNCMSMHWFH